MRGIVAAPSRRGRGRPARWMAAVSAVVLMAAIVLLSSGPAAARCIPVVYLGCPPSTPSGPPTVQVGQSNAAGYRTAIVRGTVNPGGARTRYHWLYQGVRPRVIPARHTRSFWLPADNSPHRLHLWLTGLVPGETYDLSLVATNRYGKNYQWSTPAFRTPQHPVLSALRLSRDVMRLGYESLRAFVRVRGAFNPYAPLRVYVSRSPYHHWRLFNDLVYPARHRATRMQVCPRGYFVASCSLLDRNFLVEVRDGRARTAPLLVWVYPAVSLYVDRENGGASPWLDAEVLAGIHHVTRRHFHPQSVYFYFGPTRRGPWSLIGSKPLHIETDQPGTDAELAARIRYYSRAAGHVYICTRHQLVADMGRPVFFRACGRRHLP